MCLTLSNFMGAQSEVTLPSMPTMVAREIFRYLKLNKVQWVWKTFLPLRATSSLTKLFCVNEVIDYCKLPINHVIARNVSWTFYIDECGLCGITNDRTLVAPDDSSGACEYLRSPPVKHTQFNQKWIKMSLTWLILEVEYGYDVIGKIKNWKHCHLWKIDGHFAQI